MKKMQQIKFKAYRRIFFVMSFIKHNSKCRSIKKINWVGENTKKNHGKGTREGSDREEKIKKNRGKKIKLEKDFPYGCIS